MQTFNIIDSCLTTTISCSNVASCTLIVEQQIIGLANAGLPDLQLRLWYVDYLLPSQETIKLWINEVSLFG